MSETDKARPPPGSAWSGLARLRAMPIVAKAPPPPHPLAIYIAVRGLSLAEAAPMLEMSERQLRRIVRWQSKIAASTGRMIALELGLDPDVVFSAEDYEANAIRKPRSKTADTDDD